MFPKTGAKLQKNYETRKYSPHFYTIFLHYAISVLQNEKGGAVSMLHPMPPQGLFVVKKKVGIVLTTMPYLPVSGAENDLEYHLTAQRMLTNKTKSNC